MKLDPLICYNALSSRDSRFDGKFYIAVRTTGVYCRPICPAPTALLKNCTFYTSATAAEVAGYRPCLRCFPESSPDFVPDNISSEIVISAIIHIQRGELEEGNIESLASSFGVSSRHLRRLFEEHLGVSPMQLIKTRRVHLAKKLINETQLSMSKIAFIAGFPNVRQFNSEIKKTYGKPPTELRRRKTIKDSSTISIKLSYRPPLNWHQIEEYLKPRLITGVECFRDGCYRRALKLNGEYGIIEVKCSDSKHNLTLSVPTQFWPHLQLIIRKTRELFDLDADTETIESHLSNDHNLRKIIENSEGSRVLGAWDFFELSLRAIIGQQVTVLGAATLTGRFVEHYGDPLPPGFDQHLFRLFPTPEQVIGGNVKDVGFPNTRANTITDYCKAYINGDFEFEGRTSLDEIIAKLTSVKGVGDWTANYIAMRALRETDAFPSGDLGLTKAYGFLTQENTTPKELSLVSEKWRPWRSYAAVHLWNSL